MLRLDAIDGWKDNGFQDDKVRNVWINSNTYAVSAAATERMDRRSC